MDKREVAQLVGELKGAPASVVLALLLLGRPLGLPDLAAITRYSAPTLRAGIDRLALLGFVQEERSVGQYVLTVQGRQFILGEVGLQVTVDDWMALEEKNFFLPHVHGCEALPSSSSENTIIPDVENEKIFFDADAEEAIRLLVDLGRYETTRTGKGARDSVAAALRNGWSGSDCVAAVAGWVEYWESEEGSWIKDAGYIAYALRERRKPPTKKKGKADPTNPMSYISGEYGHLIKH